MNIEQADNSILRQCMSLSDLAQPLTEGLLKGLAESGLKELLPQMDQLIITGCGDSYYASMAGSYAFRHYCKAEKPQVSYMRTTDLLHHYSFGCHPEKTMVIGISASGGTAAIADVLKRARKAGCVAVALSGNPDSVCAKEAGYCIETHLPAFPEGGPGLRTYYASVLALDMLAAWTADLKAGNTEFMDALVLAVVTCTKKAIDSLASQKERLLAIAREWDGIRKIEIIGDAGDYANAGFIAAKFIEAAGLHSALSDSENWCHVNYFACDPKSIGTVIVTQRSSASFTRVRETMKSVRGIHRSYVLFTDGTAEDYNTDPAYVIRIPSVPKELEFTGALLGYLPGAALAAYCSAVREEPYFRAPDAPQWTNPVGMTIKERSETVIVEPMEDLYTKAPYFK